MLQSIIIKNFKSYKDAELPLSPLTMLIGANASGKSNIIEALRFLSWLAQGHKLSSLRYQIQDSDVLIRGGISDLCRLETNVFEIGCSVFTGEWNNLMVGIGLTGNELRIVSESIIAEQQKSPLYRVEHKSIPPGNDISVSYNNFASGGKKPQITCTDQMSVFVQLESAARFEKGHQKAQSEIPKIVRQYIQALSNILFLDPVPSVMRQASNKAEYTLRGDGKNLSAVLYNLCKVPEIEKGILDFIESLPEQKISSLDFVDDIKQNVLVMLIENFGDRAYPWDATLLSDGTLRVLSIAAALYSAVEGSLVVIEEIDNGVHPSRAKKLMSSIQNIAEKRNIRVLLTTHNPALLDAVPDEAIGNVVFCYRDPEEGDSRLVRLKDMESFPELVTQDKLGSLMTKGIIDRFVKHQQSYEENLIKTEKWLSRVKEGE